MPHVSLPEGLFDRTLDRAIADLAGGTGVGGYRFEDDAGTLRDLSFPALERRTACAASALHAQGLRVGDRVVVILPDPADFVPFFLGAIRGGLVPVPLSPPMGFGTGDRYLDMLARACEHCEAGAVLADARLSAAIAAQRPGLRLLAASGLDGDPDFAPCARSLDDLCFLQFTSGSTGRHRAVVIRHGNVAANVRAMTQAFGDRGLELGVDQAVTWLPLFHDMGLIGHVILPVFLRTPVTMLTPLTFLKRPRRWLEAISRQRAAVSFAPNFAYALTARRLRQSDLVGLDLSCWKVAGCGAEPIRPRDLQRFAALTAAAGFDPGALTPAYGLAEATVAVSFEPGAGLVVDRVCPESLRREGWARVADPDAPAVDIASCGAPLVGMEVAVFAEDDAESREPLPERRVGELRLRGPSVSSGYLGAPPGDPHLFAGGWLRTGDQGYLGGGRVHVCGRLKDLIIVHGRNYRPEDIEWLAAEVDGVFGRMALAFGIPGDDGAEQVVVAVETLATDPLVRQRLVGAVKRDIYDGLGLLVSSVIPVDRGVLPRTTSGKPQRYLAREWYRERGVPTPRDEQDAVGTPHGARGSTAVPRGS